MRSACKQLASIFYNCPPLITPRFLTPRQFAIATEGFNECPSVRRQVLLNVLADGIHRAHQRCLNDGECDPNLMKRDLVFEAGAEVMAALQGSYSCICLVHGVGTVAFRDPLGIRCPPPPSSRKATRASLGSANPSPCMDRPSKSCPPVKASAT